MVDLREPKQWTTLASVWNRLMREKKILVTVVYQRTSADRISAEDKKIPAIKERLDRNGYIDVSSSIRPAQLDVLEALLKLGYVKKRRSTISKTWFGKQVCHYEPILTPFGALPLTGPQGHSSSSYHLERDQYNRMVTDFKQTKDEMAKGMHPQIKDISLGVEYEYDTDVYEVEDEFFDAVYLQIKDDKLRVWLTLPFIESSDDGKDRKNWERLGEADSTRFLGGKDAFRPEIGGLEWKKGSIGVLVFDDEGYFIVPSATGPIAKPSESPKLLEELAQDFGPFRQEDDMEALRDDFRILALEVLELLTDCNDSSRQTARCPISPIFETTAQAVKIAGRLPTQLPSSRTEVGSLAEDLAKLVYEDSHDGTRINQVVLRDVDEELRVIMQLRHQEAHDREVGSPGAVQRKYFEIGNIFLAMIGSPVPTSSLHWGQLGCCLLLVARQILREVLTSIRALA